jgi:hypothetical protein
VALQLGERQDGAADAPAAVDDLVDEDHRVRPGLLAEEVGVHLGDLIDEVLLSGRQ